MDGSSKLRWIGKKLRLYDGAFTGIDYLTRRNQYQKKAECRRAVENPVKDFRTPRGAPLT
jgi:hypothetical protein